MTWEALREYSHDRFISLHIVPCTASCIEQQLDTAISSAMYPAYTRGPLSKACMTFGERHDMQSHYADTVVTPYCDSSTI